ncbi:hypothetical protein B0H13DRAFT_1859918 [Mycena leptocephala]|nr:hypothetical protein B0H13DRAFT_1859918 [Mycena leptocephala]
MSTGRCRMSEADRFAIGRAKNFDEGNVDDLNDAKDGLNDDETRVTTQYRGCKLRERGLGCVDTSVCQYRISNIESGRKAEADGHTRKTSPTTLRTREEKLHARSSTSESSSPRGPEIKQMTRKEKGQKATFEVERLRSEVPEGESRERTGGRSGGTSEEYRLQQYMYTRRPKKSTKDGTRAQATCSTDRLASLGQTVRHRGGSWVDDRKPESHHWQRIGV